MTTSAQATTEPELFDTCTLDIGGMTCASCVGRVEKALNRLEGVTAQVNLATEAATVRFDPTHVGLAELTAVVAKAGYTATPRRDVHSGEGQPTAATAAAGSAETDDRDDHLTALSMWPSR